MAALALATAVGALAAVGFAAAWFPEVRDHCGVVRLYEILWGLLVLVLWAGGAAGGLLPALADRKQGRAVAWRRAAVPILVGAAMSLYAARAAVGIANQDYALEDTATLLALLDHGGLDQQKIAALALGKRKAAAGVPALSAVAARGGGDVNLRFNAVRALGQILAPPTPAGTDVQTALAALLAALDPGDEFLPDAACEALGQARDPRAVEPLARVLADASRPGHTRTEAARALERMDTAEARKALEAARSGK